MLFSRSRLLFLLNRLFVVLRRHARTVMDRDLCPGALWRRAGRRAGRRRSARARAANRHRDGVLSAIPLLVHHRHPPGLMDRHVIT